MVGIPYNTLDKNVADQVSLLGQENHFLAHSFECVLQVKNAKVATSETDTVGKNRFYTFYERGKGVSF